MAANNSTLGDCCTTGTLHKGTTTGKVETVAGLPTYVVGEKSDKVVVMVSDVFGWELTNTRLLADDYAKHGFYVLLPDFFFGDSLDAKVERMLSPPESAPPRGFFQAISQTFTAASKGGPWLFNHRDAVSKPIIDKFFTALRQDLPTAKIGAVGFCWGGRHVVLLTHADSSVQVDCVVACHPSMLSVPGDIQKVTKPLSIQVGDKDQMVRMSVKQADQARETIEQKGIAGEVKVYPGQVHGFACRGDLDTAEIKEGKEQCTKATVDWLSKYLTVKA
ncbi:Dienelactone hydrolase family protein [Taphrina deformans PYCC 5710]|uniref:Dienelactone hydrolase family protein n=1 Tax=Taphrina deformans (strain PYCC 5710 / ATCC 11124 / CBS 356.35 / IMI 108563 / JCM 9778 / NBRC 8474) TaxID=1097556 RepID=R4X972_TAPDE|nr:Dienelactone hydrolase family protein [Taphrina deformans PYCC 5710]|eukprot:CCG80722.1 Dienelactone hydrolase family protein [Taphrina deformans PYCC 5710]